MISFSSVVSRKTIVLPVPPHVLTSDPDPSEPDVPVRAAGATSTAALTADEAALARRLAPVMARPVIRASGPTSTRQAASRQRAAGPSETALPPPLPETLAVASPLVPDVAIVALLEQLAADDVPLDALPLDALPPDAAAAYPPPKMGARPNWLVPERRPMRNRVLVWLAWLVTAMVIAATMLAASIAFLGGERVAGYATEAGVWLARIVEWLTKLFTT